MIRPLTLLSLAGAAAAGLYLYQVKHAVAQLDRELREINRQTEQARERTQVLTAEWALLNQPERLRQVAQRHLSLEPMAPAQFARMSDLRERLPAARDFAGPPSFAPAPAPAAPDVAVAVAAAEPTAPVTAPAARAPEAPARAMAAAPPAPARTETPAEAPAAVAEAPARPARPSPPPAAEPTRLAAAAPRPPARPATPVRRAVHVEQTQAQPRPAPRSVVTAPPVTSVFGGVATLAPPVPIARAATGAYGTN